MCLPWYKIMEETKAIDMSQGNIRNIMFRLAIPTIIAQIINVLYNIVDRMYIGHIEGYGTDALTGVGVCVSLITFVSAFASLIGAGGAPRAAIFMGKKRNDEAQHILGNCLSALILIAVLLTAIMLLFNEKLLLMFGASENTIHYARSYMDIYAVGSVFVLVALGMNPFITCQGFSRYSMITTMIGAICNIILDPVFIFVFRMGVRGAAFATIISQGISCIWVLKFLTGKRTALKIKRSDLKLKPSIIGPVIALGLSPFTMAATESILSICFNTSLLKYGGDMAVCSMTILNSIMQFSFLPVRGFNEGAQPVISYNYGAGDMDRVKKGFKVVLSTCLIYTFTLWLLVMLFPDMFNRLFTSDAAQLDMSRWTLRVYMASSCLFGAQMACQQTFMALGNAKTSLFLAVFRKIILLIPLIYIIPGCFSGIVSIFFDDYMVASVFLAEPIADFIAVCTTVTMFTGFLKKVTGEKEQRK